MIDALQQCDPTLSTRKVLVSFFSKVFEEYREYGRGLPLSVGFTVWSEA